MLGIPPCHTLQTKESKLAQSKIQSQSIVSLSQKDKDYTCQSSIKFLLQQSQATVLQAVDCKEYREANDASHLCACDLHGCWFAWLFPSSPNLVGEGEKWTRRCWRWYPPGGSCREVRQFTSASGLDWLGHKLPWEFEHLSSFTSSLRTRSYLSSGPTMHDLPKITLLKHPANCLPLLCQNSPSHPVQWRVSPGPGWNVLYDDWKDSVSDLSCLNSCSVMWLLNWNLPYHSAQSEIVLDKNTPRLLQKHSCTVHARFRFKKDKNK